MYCSKCGARVAELDRRCAQCGAPLAFPPPEPDRPGGGPPGWAPGPAVAPRPAPPTGVAQPRERLLYGGFWRRLGSWLVDFAVTAPFAYALQYALGIDPFQTSPWSLEYWRVQALLMLLRWLYSALLESSRWQGSLGQQLLGLRVCNLAGSRIGFGRATVRHFAQLLSFATFGIGYLMIAFTARKQALHDSIAGCLIVRPAPRAVEFVAPAAPGTYVEARS